MFQASLHQKKKKNSCFLLHFSVNFVLILLIVRIKIFWLLLEIVINIFFYKSVYTAKVTLKNLQLYCVLSSMFERRVDLIKPHFCSIIVHIQIDTIKYFKTLFNSST